MYLEAETSISLRLFSIFLKKIQNISDYFDKSTPMQISIKTPLANRLYFSAG